MKCKHCNYLGASGKKNDSRGICGYWKTRVKPTNKTCRFFDKKNGPESCDSGPMKLVI